MRYFMFIKSDERYRKQAFPQGLMDAMGEFVTAGFKSGKLIDTGGLKPSVDGTRMSMRGGKLTVTDGPFTETKEVIGGYAIVEAESRQAALDYAKEFVELHRVHWPDFDFECEVRPMDGP